MLMCVGFKEVLIHLLCCKIFLHTFLWILFVMGLEQIPGINLQMRISAKVDNTIMTKIAYSVIDLTFANFLLFFFFEI